MKKIIGLLMLLAIFNLNVNSAFAISADTYRDVFDMLEESETKMTITKLIYKISLWKK